MHTDGALHKLKLKLSLTAVIEYFDLVLSGINSLKLVRFFKLVLQYD